jgi:hypothetical protein
MPLTITLPKPVIVPTTMSLLVGWDGDVLSLLPPQAATASTAAAIAISFVALHMT